MFIFLNLITTIRYYEIKLWRLLKSNGHLCFEEDLIVAVLNLFSDPYWERVIYNFDGLMAK
jgi:hypothetical protein